MALLVAVDRLIRTPPLVESAALIGAIYLLNLGGKYRQRDTDGPRPLEKVAGCFDVSKVKWSVEQVELWKDKLGSIHGRLDIARPYKWQGE